MTEIVDGDELLRRLRAARDWARVEEENATDETTATAYRAVRTVLDRLVDPSRPTGH
ncbi:hypothetical protein ACE14D_19220 [Streptomyces sp. Act-28]